MVKLYFSGGHDKHVGNPKKAYTLAISEAGGNPIVLIFLWTSNNYSEPNPYRKLNSEFFKKIGAGNVVFAELSDSFNELKRKINSSDIIYLPGGDPFILMKNLRKKKAENLIRKYNKIIIGNSAGAMVMCKEFVYIKGQDGSSETGTSRGLGLINFGVSVHYQARVPVAGGFKPYAELRKLSKRINIKIYAIPEYCILKYDGDFRCFGKIYEFYKGKRTRIY